jgi:hypothetical protein
MDNAGLGVRVPDGSNAISSSRETMYNCAQSKQPAAVAFAKGIKGAERSPLRREAGRTKEEQFGRVIAAHPE